jgi:hypothetical protein
VLDDLKRSMRRWPTATFVVGIFNVDAGQNKGDRIIGTVDFTPIHYADLADALLEDAVERMAAMSPLPLDLIAQCERARGVPGFERVVRRRLTQTRPDRSRRRSSAEVPSSASKQTRSLCLRYLGRPLVRCGRAGLEGHLMPEDIDYRGYQLSIMHSAPRWYAAIHPTLSHQPKPNRREELASGATREEAIGEAERTVNRLLKI